MTIPSEPVACDSWDSPPLVERLASEDPPNCLQCGRPWKEHAEGKAAWAEAFGGRRRSEPAPAPSSSSTSSSSTSGNTGSPGDDDDELRRLTDEELTDEDRAAIEVGRAARLEDGNTGGRVKVAGERWYLSLLANVQLLWLTLQLELRTTLTEGREAGAGAGHVFWIELQRGGFTGEIPGVWRVDVALGPIKVVVECDYEGDPSFRLTGALQRHWRYG